MQWISPAPLLVVVHAPALVVSRDLYQRTHGLGQPLAQRRLSRPRPRWDCILLADGPRCMRAPEPILVESLDELPPIARGEQSPGETDAIDRRDAGNQPSE